MLTTIWNKKTVLGAALLAVISSGLTSCTSDPNSPGIEFMPDMYRPQPYEAYLEKHDVDSADFYERNIEKIAPNFDDLPDSASRAEVIKEVDQIWAVWNGGSATRKPVDGTIAQGKKPFPVAEGDKEGAKALVNPIAYSKSVVKEGKMYYEIYCDHCHGVKGDGNGPMVSKGVYPAQPPSYQGAAKELTAGEIHYTIYYGKGVMGSHASQISEDKRWKIVTYVQTLQGVNFETESAVAPSDSVNVEPTDSIN